MVRRVLNNTRTLNKRNIKIIALMVVIICVCLAFVAGFLVRGDQTLLKNLGFSALITTTNDNPGTTVSGNTYDSLSARVAEIEGVINDYSLDTFDLDKTTSSVLTAFSTSTDDPFLRYYDAARYSTYIQENSGNYTGVGVLFSEYNGKAYAVDVFENSAAKASGIQQGDFVVAIDGDRSQDWTVTETVNALARNDGDSVVVTWRRPASLEADGGAEYTTTLTCSTYSEPNVTLEVHDDVAYIAIKQMSHNSAELVKSAVLEADTQGAACFVLDIRNNPGGFLTQSVDIASLFIKSGVIVGIETEQDRNTTKTATGDTITDKPLIVLTNEYTAAAAEVLTAALKDNARATVIGTNTMGKGSVQVVKPLSFGGALRYTAAFYKSPLGYSINGAGVAPNITVGEIDAIDDSQKSFALDHAQSLVTE